VPRILSERSRGREGTHHCRHSVVVVVVVTTLCVAVWRIGNGVVEDEVDRGTGGWKEDRSSACSCSERPVSVARQRGGEEAVNTASSDQTKMKPTELEM
jgi:hypothetical protein